MNHAFFAHEERGERRRREAENTTPYRWWRPPPQFDALEALLRDIASADLLLHGLQREHAKAAAQGRIDVWASAARSIISLLEMPLFEIEKRNVAVRPTDPSASERG